ncbi:MAG: hypothetical protein QM690_21960 [Sphingobium sp.]
MAFQQSDLDRLDTAIASGIRKVTFADGRATEYQDVDAMLKAREAIEKVLATAAAGSRGRRRLTILRVGRCR